MRALLAVLVLAAGCTPELRQAEFVVQPMAGRCTASAVHLGHWWNPTMRFVTCADQLGKMRDVPVGDEKSLRELLGPLGEVFDKVMIPVGPGL